MTLRRVDLINQLNKPSNVLKRRTITISNNESSALSDFQVPIEISGGFLDKANPNKLFLVDSENVIYPYWVESWKRPEGNARIWTKVDLPASGSKTLYLYYGGVIGDNPPNGDDVFEFFDDFSSWSGWEKYGNGNLSQSDEVAIFSSYSAKKTDYGDSNGATKDIGTTLNRNIVLEAYFFRQNYNGGSSDRCGVVDSSYNGYGSEFRQYDETQSNIPQVGVDVRTSGTATTNRSNLDAGKAVFHAWYLHRLTIKDSDVVVEVAEHGGSNAFASYTITNTSYDSFSKVYIWGGYDFCVGGIWIRKYTANEPSVSIGSEELIFR